MFADEDNEEDAEEDWRGLGSEPKRKRRSYLDPSKDLLLAKYSSKKQAVPIALLRNGHLDMLKPAKIGNRSITLSNTCGFDSVVQLMATAYCDSDDFRIVVEANRELYDTCDIIIALVNEGVTRSTYRRRAVLLEKLFKANQLPEGVIHVDVECAIGTLIPRILFDCASTTTTCSQCLYKSERCNQILEVEVQSPDSIEEQIKKTIWPRLFRQKCVNPDCTGSLYKSTKLYESHMVLEPVNVSARTLTLETSLDRLPKDINIEGQRYILRGLVGYTGPDTSIGHFIAFSLRCNDIWEEYNDLKKNPSRLLLKK